uniref:Uncharacterized protein n=1 Tax=viral metagenome TaxID=1070528 RepID=A0A6M3J3S7_9ZZZZ
MSPDWLDEDDYREEARAVMQTAAVVILSALLAGLVVVGVIAWRVIG